VHDRCHVVLHPKAHRSAGTFVSRCVTRQPARSIDRLQARPATAVVSRRPPIHRSATAPRLHSSVSLAQEVAILTRLRSFPTLNCARSSASRRATGQVPYQRTCRRRTVYARVSPWGTRRRPSTPSSPTRTANAPASMPANAITASSILSACLAKSFRPKGRRTSPLH